MAPERFAGQNDDVRGDLFALGAILYECAEGRRAFPGATAPEVIYQVTNVTPPRIALGGQSILSDLIMALLSKDPAERPATARQVLGVLHEGRTTVTISGRGRRWWWVPVTASVIVAGLGIVLTLRTHVGAQHPASPAVAVLAFDNVQDPADTLRAGATVGVLVLTSLAQLSGIRVLSTQSVLEATRSIRATGAGPGIALRVARRLNADRLVTGTIVQTRPTLLVTAEVAEVRSGHVLLAARVEGAPGQQLLEVVDAVCARLLKYMAPTANAATLEPVERRASSDVRALRHYVTGLELESDGDLVAASRELDQAIVLDSTFAQAHCQRAILQWWRYDVEGARGDAAAARRHAARLSPLERGVLEGLSRLLDFRWKNARAYFTELARQYPNEKMVAYGVVEAAYHDGDLEGTIPAARRALALDPGFVVAGYHYIDALFDLQRYAEAESVARDFLRRGARGSRLTTTIVTARAVQWDPEGALQAARIAREAGAKHAACWMAASILIARDSVEAARDWMMAEDPRRWLVSDLELAYAYMVALHRGRFAEAERIAERAWAAFEEEPDKSPIADGIAAALGARHPVRALQWAESTAVRGVRSEGYPAQSRIIPLRVYYRLGRLGPLRAELARIESAAAPEDRTWRRVAGFGRALAEDLAGRPDAALEYLREGRWWVDFAGVEESVTRFTRIGIELHAGHAERALAQIDTLTRAPLMDQDDVARLTFLRGVALERLGRRDEAAAAYRRFLRQWRAADPGTPEIAQAQAALRRL